MKKTLSLLLTLVLCLSLCACGSGESTATNPDEIALTVDNYAKYLDVTAYMQDPEFTKGLNVQNKNNGDGIYYGDGSSTFYVFDNFSSRLSVKGVSANYDYNDITVTVRFTGTYKAVDLSTCEWDQGHDIKHELSVECNIAGEGSVWGNFSGNGNYMLRDMADIEWEIVEISGTVSPVK